MLEKALCSGALVKVRTSCCPIEMGSGCRLPWAPDPLLPPFPLLGRAGGFLPWLRGGREAGGCRDQAFSPVSDGRDTPSVAPAPAPGFLQLLEGELPGCPSVSTSQTLRTPLFHPSPV